VDAVEIVGYVASALVVASLAMTSAVRLRWLSLAGSLTFVGYGLLISSVPIIITNAAIAVINIWFLRKELGGQRDVGAMVVAADSPFLVDFVAFHLADIRRFQPTFAMPPVDEAVCVLLQRDGLPAGVLIGRRDGDDLHVAVDYVLRPWRDSRLGRWLFGPGAVVFRSIGITRVISEPGTDIHPGYLERVGFRRTGDTYVLDL
jgi:hypothetical protein